MGTSPGSRADVLVLFSENYLLDNPEWKEDIIPEIMDGKNVADFIDPDILEKLEALEREEEKLQAEGFYDSEEDMVRYLFSISTIKINTFRQFDSDDEREAQEARISNYKKVISQSSKKGMRNRAPLPRTAALRTLSELTSGFKRAGLDSSRIKERAEMLAKVQGEKRKRQREEEEADMDVDQGDDDDDDGKHEGEWMDVDGEETTRNKRVKSNSGAVIAKGGRGPRTNRQLAGLRDDAVSLMISHAGSSSLIENAVVSNRPKLSNFGIWVNESATCMPKPERAIVPSESKWYVLSLTLRNFPPLIFFSFNTPYQPKHLFAGKRKMGKTDRR